MTESTPQIKTDSERRERRIKIFQIVFFAPTWIAPIWMIIAWFTTAGAPYQFIADWWTPTHWWELAAKIIFTLWTTVASLCLVFAVFLGAFDRG